MSILLALQIGLKPSISSKDCDLDFFHDHISTKKIKEIYPQIVPNSFKFESVTKDDIKNVKRIIIKRVIDQ